MHRSHSPQRTVDRAGFLRLGAAAGLSTAAALAAGAPAARAAVPVPAPQGDDVAYLQLTATAELVAVSLGAELARSPAFSARERRQLAAARTAAKAHYTRLAAALGGDAPQYGDFHLLLPAGRRSRTLLLDRALDLGGLLAGVYLTGVGDVADPATRGLLGRLLWSQAQQLSVLRTLAGRPAAASGLPGPLSLEDAAPRLDAFLSDAVPPA